MKGKPAFAAVAGSFLAVALAVFTFPAATTLAQSVSGPQLLLTWKATNSYAPPGYIGKILPNQNSRLFASLEMISRGKVVDLSNQTIYWYLDDNLLGGGAGAQFVTFRPYGTAPTTMILKAELPDYPGGMLIQETDVPLVQPQAVINAPYPENQFSGSPVTLTAIPYFFNVTSSNALSFSWAVNGESVSSVENPQSLQVSLPQGTATGYSFVASLSVQNADGSTQATASTNLTYEKQL